MVEIGAALRAGRQRKGLSIEAVETKIKIAQNVIIALEEEIPQNFRILFMPGGLCAAGDAFTAGFVASLLRGKTIPEAHKTAVDVSRFVCTQHGAMPVLPDTLIQ